MSVASSIEMSVSSPIPGRARRAGDGVGDDEQEGTRAAGGARGPRRGPDPGPPGGAAERGRRASGVPAAEGVPGERGRGPGLAPARPSEQPPPPRRGARGRAGRDPRALRRLRADARRREAGRGPRPQARPRDGPALDGRGRAPGPAQGARPARPPAPPPPRLPGRAGAGRRLRAPLVRGPRPALHAPRLRRRRHQPADAPAVRAQREHARLPPGGEELRRGARPAGRDDGVTQFGRAMRELNVEVICANSPQAKGRVERAHKTLQDRLVKELRLAGVSTVEAANAFLPAFVADYNARFAKEPRLAEDLHRPAPGAADLDEIMTVREERTVSASLTLRYDKMLILLEPSDTTRALARQRVTVVNYPDGRFAIRHKGRDLPFRVFDKLRKVDQAAVVESKRLGAVLAHIRERQDAYEPAWNAARPHPREGQAA